ncbi:hypothetical protein GMD4S_00770 [Streptococcus sp. GMD4S]|jgi:hypothetical protein|uniref:DUF4649 family protein n=1 Tax=Streptococcus oralis TaxID=1303 RepID=A0A7T4ISS8_STROR|nr:MULTISPECIES: DUF4649 family protein [Streptococcus]EKA12097.1 hypothetical protein GMD4S_00770 [Streptococcus sp. GMD4S]EKA16620.1 hypothetical protein GMD2S_02724 [Streptococcus sp. GMD2S]EKA18468.1 hypothetical protein GMD1S_00812 [Streptococcus sp. GMD1S]QQC35491.1 DUF4649 family protein [Streptococcus oralis]
MYRLTYQDNYHVERTLEYKDYEELMLSLSGCVTLPDTLLISSLTLNDKVIYQGLVGDLYRFLSQVHFSDKN